MDDRKAKFGPAGNSDSFAQQGYTSSSQAPAYCASYGLDAYEYQCGLGVRVREALAKEIAAEATKHGIQISLHAPYYISLSSLEESKRLGSARYFLESAQALRHLGGVRMVAHAGSCGKQSRQQALEFAVESLRYCQQQLDDAGFSDMVICPETMGKINQLGTLEEVLALCAVDERILPCLDFGHLNARTHGGIQTEEDYARILDAMENALGVERASQFHSHFSKIEYSDGGEKCHLTFEDTIYGPDPRSLMRQIAKRGWSPTIICESAGTQAEDAKTMREMYEEELEKL